MSSFENQKIFMTGGSGTIGMLLGARLVNEGGELVVLSRTDRVPAGARHIQADLSTAPGIAAAQAAVAREEPGILINLAGAQYCGLVERQHFDEIHSLYLINVVAPVALCQACLPAMKRRNQGQLVNVGSVLGSVPMAYFAAYSSTKSALRAFSEALRRELASTAVSVTHVSPRAARTGFVTPRIAEYMRITRMNVDEPTVVADAILDAIKRRRRETFFGFPESLFARLNAAWPRLIDLAVGQSDRKVRSALFAAMKEGL